METKSEINTVFDVGNYCALVEGIANGYFNEKGEYLPYLGRMNTLALFFNKCVSNYKIDGIDDKIEDLLQVDAIIKDNVIMAEYEKVLKATDNLLSFGAAYKEAMKIVDYRKSSAYVITRFFTELANQYYQLIDNINDISRNAGNDESMEQIVSESSDTVSNIQQ